MNFTRLEYRLFRVLTTLTVVLAVLFFLLSLIVGVLRVKELPVDVSTENNGQMALAESAAGGVITRQLPESADAGQGYIDRMVFLGESTTAHLRSRGVLSGGTRTDQVWTTAQNTMCLDLNILSRPILYPKTGESMTIPQAIALDKPAYMVLSFGTNRLLEFHDNPSAYATAYGKLISAIHEASPETVVLLQTVYPLAANQTAFSVDAVTLNTYIKSLNEQLLTIAQQHDAFVVDTARCLRGEDGMLRGDYQTDGVHLTESAYRAILQYLRTHAYADGR